MRQAPTAKFPYYPRKRIRRGESLAVCGAKLALGLCANLRAGYIIEKMPPCQQAARLRSPGRVFTYQN